MSTVLPTFLYISSGGGMVSSASLERKGSIKMLRVALFEGLRLLGRSLPLSQQWAGDWPSLSSTFSGCKGRPY